MPFGFHLKLISSFLFVCTDCIWWWTTELTYSCQLCRPYFFNSNFKRVCQVKPSCRYTGQAVLLPPPLFPLSLHSPPRLSPQWRTVWSRSGHRCSRGLLGAPAALPPSAPCSAGRTDLSGPPTLWFAPPGTPCCSASLRQNITHTQTNKQKHAHKHNN